MKNNEKSTRNTDIATAEIMNGTASEENSKTLKFEIVQRSPTGCHIAYGVSGVDKLQPIKKDIYIPSTWQEHPVLSVKRAFIGNDNIEKVWISDGIVKIDAHAFDGCHELIAIRIPKSMRSIGEEAFSYCGNLKYVLYGGSEREFEKIDLITTVHGLPDSEFGGTTIEPRGNVALFRAAFIENVKSIDTQYDHANKWIRELPEYPYSVLSIIFGGNFNKTEASPDCAEIEEAIKHDFSILSRTEKAVMLYVCKAKMTIQGTADKLNISPDKANCLIASILRKLRYPANSKELRKLANVKV